MPPEWEDGEIHVEAPFPNAKCRDCLWDWPNAKDVRKWARAHVVDRGHTVDVFYIRTATLTPKRRSS